MRDLDAYYILEGKTVLKVGRETCYRWLSQNRNGPKKIAQETVGNFWVSTVFLTHDHSMHDEGPPIVFETTVFRLDADGEPDMGGEHTDRCATHEEAEAMHKRVCDVLRAGKDPQTEL